MAGPLPPAARGRDADMARCPSCGSGDLCSVQIARPRGDVWKGVYCAGEYDRERRRVLRRGCGYAGAAGERTQPAVEILEPVASAGR
jgi:hypothetical protein